MKCPFCAFEGTRVLDSRDTKNGQAIRRRRECEKCSGRFSTYEAVEASQWTIVKRDGRKESYDREKLKSGIARALEKRPNADEKVGRTLGEVESALHTMETAQVASRDIGKLVMNTLRDIDEVAYLRFASVYKSFGSVKSFQREIDRIEEQNES